MKRRLALAAGLMAGALGRAGHAALVADPVGDTLGIAQPQLDVSSLGVTLGAASLQVVIDFDGDIGQPVGGLVELDTDANPSTGAPSYVTFLCPGDSGLGVERRIDLFTTDASGAATVVDGAWQPVGTAQVTVQGKRLSIVVPGALLASGTALRAAAVVGPAATEVTDCVPDLGAVTAQAAVDVPALDRSGRLLLGAGLALAGLTALRRARFAKKRADGLLISAP